MCEFIIPCVRKAFAESNIPTPVRHVAEGQNSVDFILEGDKTLSVKTNQVNYGKVAPQQLGQPTSRTYFTIMSNELGEDLSVYVKSDNYPDKARIFKKISMTRTAEVLNVYWRHIFECDYLIHFFNILNDRRDMWFLVSFLPRNGIHPSLVSLKRLILGMKAVP